MWKAAEAKVALLQARCAFAQALAGERGPLRPTRTLPCSLTPYPWGAARACGPLGGAWAGGGGGELLFEAGGVVRRNAGPGRGGKVVPGEGGDSEGERGLGGRECYSHTRGGQDPQGSFGLGNDAFSRVEGM